MENDRLREGIQKQHEQNGTRTTRSYVKFSMHWKQRKVVESYLHFGKFSMLLESLS